MASQLDNEERPQYEFTPLIAQSQSYHHDVYSSARRLYISHFLSTWNSRAFEFGAVLYLATVFPGTLLPMSLYALVRGLSAIIFAPAIGLYIDTGHRLRVVRMSIGEFFRILIILQRLAVAASCAIFYVLAKKIPLGHGGRTGMLALVAVFACVEKLSSIVNLVSVEKDWVIAVVDNDLEALKAMNAQMRRIDLLCKLLGPLFIALLNGYSTELAITVNFAINAVSIGLEYFAIAKVYKDTPNLQNPKTAAETETDIPVRRNRNWILDIARKSVQDFGLYFRHHAFFPSIAEAILYLTVLGFSGQMITYLFSAGYNSAQIGISRTLSVMFEVLATWMGPWLMGRIGALRAGLWMSIWQVVTLVIGVSIFWIFESKPFLSASGLVGGTILSRIGLRGFDLCVQFIIQKEVEPENRGAFSSVEAAWQNAFELLSYATTVVFFRPDQFKWPSLISVVAVATASAVYTTCVYLRGGICRKRNTESW